MGTSFWNDLGLFGREDRLTTKVSGFVPQVRTVMMRANDRIKNTPETEAANVNYSKEGGGVFAIALVHGFRIEGGEVAVTMTRSQPGRQ